MFAIIGVAIVFMSVVGGYVLEHGNLSLLFQPVELLIIGGAAMGAFFISSTPRVFGIVLKSIATVLAPKSQSKAHYVELLSLLFQLFSKIRKEGLVSVEADVEAPEKSAIFQKYPSVLSNHHMLNFICDNLKVIVTANIPPHELDNLMVIIDYNKLQAMDRLENIIGLEPLAAKWKAFGWETIEVDGHSYEDIFRGFKALDKKKNRKLERDRYMQDPSGAERVYRELLDRLTKAM